MWLSESEINVQKYGSTKGTPSCTCYEDTFGFNIHCTILGIWFHFANSTILFNRVHIVWKTYAFQLPNWSQLNWNESVHDYNCAVVLKRSVFFPSEIIISWVTFVVSLLVNVLQYSEYINVYAVTWHLRFNTSEYFPSRKFCDNENQTETMM